MIYNIHYRQVRRVVPRTGVVHGHRLHFTIPSTLQPSRSPSLPGKQSHLGRLGQTLAQEHKQVLREVRELQGGPRGQGEHASRSDICGYLFSVQLRE